MLEPNERLPVSALERIDEQCAEFEAALRRKERPSIETHHGQVKDPTERRVLLSELLALEIDYRRRSGENPLISDYANRFPDDRSVIEDALSAGRTQATSTTFSPPSLDRLESLFPSLEIIELIGSGGMGAVYKARQKGLDRLVAIKILPEEKCHDMKFAMRFTREARALARLNHPSIVSVHEFGNSQGVYYFLMEFVDGPTLRDVIASQELTPEQALQIVPALCDALQYAHDQGVVHRDIKPENILLNREGQVKVADFGLSRLLDHDDSGQSLTGTHQVMGTLRYMAPEQMEGARGVDHRADIYSLGVVFYEMLTGELPLGRFAAPSEKVQIDVRLDEVVLRTLEKEPIRRYQRAGQVKTDLESIASDPDHAMPTVSKPSKAKVDLEQQELAARLLIHRRELMKRVSSALRPLFWGQIIQVFLGIAMITLGIACWTPNMDTPHRMYSGIILHVYGVLMIIAAGLTSSRIGRIDYTKPIASIRNELNIIRRIYLCTGSLIGFAWWLLWLPLALGLGLDIMLHPYVFWPAIVIGLVGWVVSLGLVVFASRRSGKSTKQFTNALGGKSLVRANLALDEIEAAQVK